MLRQIHSSVRPSFLVSRQSLQHISSIYEVKTPSYLILRTMASSDTDTRYKLVFFAPSTDLEPIKEAIFATGAGRYPGAGDYSKACFTSRGIGQFVPGASAKPAIGEPGKPEEVDESRVEILCIGTAVAKEAVAALKRYVSACEINLVAHHCSLVRIRMRCRPMRCTKSSLSDCINLGPSSTRTNAELTSPIECLA